MLARAFSDPIPSGAAASVRAGAMKSARRHSRRVRLLKWVLPVAALAMAAGFAFQSWRATPVVTDVKADESSIADGKLIMANPKLDGFTRDNLPYSMIASRAIQDVADQGVVALEGIGAKLPINTSDWADVAARSGVFDRAKNTLELKDQIKVETAGGVRASLQSASVDMGSGSMRTDEPVEIRFRGSTINADRMSVAGGGKVVTFESRVRVNIMPAQARGADQIGDIINAGQ